MPNLGPPFDLATRLATLEDQVRRMQQNPLGQAFSATQSDGSVGWQIYQDQATGSTAMVFRQGSTTARDPQTNQHPVLLYIGELVSGGAFVDSGAIFYRPDGSESAVIGNRGFTILDKAGNQILAPDEDSGQGLARPYLPMAALTSNNVANWPSTTSTSLGTIATANVYLQHPRVHWQGSAYAPAGTSGSVQLYLPGNVALGSAVTVPGGGFVGIDQTFTIPGYSFMASTELVVQAQVTAGTGAVSCQSSAYGVQS